MFDVINYYEVYETLYSKNIFLILNLNFSLELHHSLSSSQSNLQPSLENIT